MRQGMCGACECQQTRRSTHSMLSAPSVGALGSCTRRLRGVVARAVESSEECLLLRPVRVFLAPLAAQ